jgi:hypothetical protein
MLANTGERIILIHSVLCVHYDKCKPNWDALSIAHAKTNSPK